MKSMSILFLTLFVMLCSVTFSTVIGVELFTGSNEGEELPPTSSIDFPNAAAIRKGIDSIEIPQYAVHIKFSRNCEPVITFPNNPKEAFILACEYGQGRVILFGKYFGIVAHFEEWIGGKMVDNMIKWLTKGAVNKVSSVKTVEATDWQNANSNDVIMFNTAHHITDTNGFLAKLAEGSINVLFGETMWPGRNRENYQFFFNALSVDYYIYVSTIYKTPITLTENDYSTFPLSFDKALPRMERSHKEFLRLNKQFMEMTTEFVFKDVSQDTKARVTDLSTKYHSYATENCPTQNSPLSDQDKKKTIAAYGYFLRSQLLSGSGIKAPCQAAFPGDVSTTVPRYSVIVNVTAINKYDMHSTGFYLAPGDTLNYELVSSSSNTEWYISLGCFRRTLYNRVDNSGYDLTRFPDTVTWSEKFGVLVKRTTGTLYSGFGGTVLIHNWGKSSSDAKLSLKISGVVKAPFLNMRAADAQARWEESSSSLDNFAPVAELQGSYFSICIPSTMVYNRPLNDLTTLFTNYWDPTVLSQVAMRNLNVDTARMERFSIDVQLPYGSGISGYPIEAYLNWEKDLVDLEYVRTTGSWGVCHEIGHNMDDYSIDFYGSMDVTNNVFCLMNWNLFWGIDVYDPRIRITEPPKLAEITELLNRHNDTTVDFSIYRTGHSFPLAMFGQIVKHFGMGSMQRFYAINFNNVPRSSQMELHDVWFEGLSNATGYNLHPLFSFWHFTVSTEAGERQKSKTCFLPNDILTAKAPARLQAISAQFNDACVDQTAVTAFELNYPADKLVRNNDVEVTIES